MLGIYRETHMDRMKKSRAVKATLEVLIVLSVAGTAAWLTLWKTASPPPATLTIKFRVDAGPWKSDTAIYPLKGQRVTLKVDEIAGGIPRWYQIIPDISKIYQNCNHPWEPDAYKWVGFAKIDYSRKELVGCRGRWEIEPFSSVSHQRGAGRVLSSLSVGIDPAAETPHYHEDVGTFWYEVEVERDGRTERSPGLEDLDKRGLPSRVFRVSVREGDGYLGYLTSFFNVPGVFGSIPYQSSNYIGVDCCDALVAAYGKWKGKPIEKDYNVDTLVARLPRLAELNVVNGKPDKWLIWGKDVRPGDFIAVRFRGADRYQHIGALYSDKDSNGVLSEDDLVLHAGPLPLRHSHLQDGFFDGHVVILDPQLSLLPSRDNPLLQYAKEIMYLFK